MRHDVCFIDSFTSADSLIVNVTTAPYKYPTIDGISRQCFHLCWPGMFSNFMWGAVPGTTLGIEGPFAKLKLDLYIQPHTLHRFRERTESVEVTLRYLALYESFDFPKFHNVRPGTSLLEYRIYDTIIGYFRVEAVCGVALIRTFLFVTNTGSPEGDRLNRILGAGKADKEFFGIDKLSTLVTTDLLQNSNLRIAFIEAGLEPLMQFCEKHSSKAKCKKGFSSFFDRDIWDLPIMPLKNRSKRLKWEMKWFRCPGREMRVTLGRTLIRLSNMINSCKLPFQIAS
jgi:hypothetical protein